MIDLKRINGVLGVEDAANYTAEDAMKMGIEIIKSDVNNYYRAMKFMRHVQNNFAQERHPLRLRAALYEILLTAQHSMFPELLALLLEALPAGEEVFGEMDPAVVEGYVALAACARSLTAKEGGGKPKALKAAKTALKRKTHILGANHASVHECESLVERLDKALHKHSRFEYRMDVNFLFP